MKAVITALAAVSEALAKHGVTYVTIGSHRPGDVSMSIQCDSDEQVSSVALSLELAAPTLVRGPQTYWYESTGMVGRVRVAAYGRHRPLPVPGPIDDASLAEATAALAVVAQTSEAA